MFSYDIAKEYEQDGTDCVGTNPYWLLAIIRYASPLTASREKMYEIRDDKDQTKSVSFTDEVSLYNETKETLVIDSDCVQLSVSTRKGNATSSLTAVLINSGFNYAATIMPGDWVFAWIVNSPDKRDELKGRIKRGDPCNRFDDGFKFIGKVHDMGKTLMQSPTGLRTVQYNLQAVAFKELDNRVFFELQFAQKFPSLGQYLARLNISLKNIYVNAVNDSGNGGISSDKAIPELINTMIGRGIPEKLADPGGSGLPMVRGPTSDTEVPYAYVIPDSVAALLGIKNKSKGEVYSAADMYESVIGLQKYNESSNKESTANGYRNIAGFHPELQNKDDGGDVNRHRCKLGLKGRFMELPMSFDGKSLMDLIKDFLNPAINEVYSTLKLAPSGRVSPTLVVRQLPLSSPIFAKKDPTLVTSFMEVPRWKANDITMRTMDIGRSNQTHFNFVHVYGQPSANTGLKQSLQILNNPPFFEEADVKRHGMGVYATQVSCGMQDLVKGPRVWMLLMSDILMGQQFSLNGAATMLGVSAPICIGDNFEFDGTVFHIDGVTHTCSINNGTKSFTTRLQLSNGMRADWTPDEITQEGGSQDALVDGNENVEFGMYSTNRKEDSIDRNPGTTSESVE